MTRSQTKTLLRGLVLIGGVLIGGLLIADTATAQITAPRILSAEMDSSARLEEQLINRLHATTEDQAAYLRHVVKLVEEEKLEARLVVAIERYALRRNPQFAFPYFERALRYEAAKRGVALVSLRHFQSTADAVR